MGNAAAGMLVQDALAGCASFDDLVAAAPARLSENEGHDIALALGGFSDARGVFEVWYGRTGTGQQFARLELAAGYGGQPQLTDEQWLRGFGKPMRTAAQIVDVDDFARTVLTLQREHVWGPAQGYPRNVHLVGGWGELATVTRDGADIRRIIDWPDQIGELIQVPPIDFNEWRRTHAEQADPAPAPTSQSPRVSRHERRRAAKAQARKAA
ncbi:MAG TPA: hypothetical protein VFA80_10355 [Xanthobacteraceae bacterium]|nr:hypothetical protein [Xanthobacteraceae bacterium]